jgi:hypothetical protein
LLLKLEDGEPYDPSVFVTVIPSWSLGETLLVTAHQRLRILAVDYDLDDELAVFTVTAAVTLVGLEDDLDYHLVLRSGPNHMIAEHLPRSARDGPRLFDAKWWVICNSRDVPVWVCGTAPDCKPPFLPKRPFRARKRKDLVAMRVWLSHRVRPCRRGRQMPCRCGLGVVSPSPGVSGVTVQYQPA